MYLRGLILATWTVLVMILTAHGSLIDEQLYALPNKVNYRSAVNLCKSQGMNLVKILDESSNQAVFQFAVHKGLGQYWIDANDVQTEGQWVYNDGSRIVYSKWHPGEPNNWGNNEDCVHGLYYQNGYWNDVNCDINIAVICFKERSTDALITFGENQLEALPDKVNYDSALSLCKSRGMNLVRIENDAMNQLVFNFAVQRRLGQYWMDANDKVTEGQWVYSDGKRIVYSKWHPGEPNNWAKEDCVHGLYYQNGFWNDVNCNINIAVICYRNVQPPKPEPVKPEVEIKPKLESMTIYQTEEKSTYDEAVQYCKSQNYKLIRVDDEDVNKAVYNMAVKQNIGSYWVDGNDRKEAKKFVDSGNSPLIYKKFNGENSHQAEDAHCIAVVANPYEFWSYANCDSKNAVICFEIKA